MAALGRWSAAQLAAFERKKAHVALHCADIAQQNAVAHASRMLAPAINDQLCESAIQQQFIVWARAREIEDWRLRLLFAVPNGGKRDARTAHTLNKEGVRRGVCDVMLPCPSGPYSGLAIEFKARRGATSSDQKNYMADLERAGWLVKICRSSLAAIHLVTNYLERNV